MVPSYLWSQTRNSEHWNLEGLFTFVILTGDGEAQHEAKSSHWGQSGVSCGGGLSRTVPANQLRRLEQM